MTQEEKQLLLKDLCARLPYGVHVDIYSWQKNSPKLLVECVPGYVGEEVVLKNLAGRHSIKEVKPYLRPLSSMTEEEINEFILISDTVLWLGDKRSTCILSLEQIDWLNAHHFDYRIDPSTGKTLIESGLALEAKEGMYKND